MEHASIKHDDHDFYTERNILNKNVEYNTVMQQFDDLISELNVLGKKAKSNLGHPENLLSIVQDVKHSENNTKIIESKPTNISADISSGHHTVADCSNINTFDSMLSGIEPCKQTYPTFSNQKTGKNMPPETEIKVLQGNVNQTKTSKSMTNSLASNSENAFCNRFIKNEICNRKFDNTFNKLPALKKDFVPYTSPVLVNTRMNYYINNHNSKQYKYSPPSKVFKKELPMSSLDFQRNLGVDSRFWNQGNLKLRSPRIPRSASKQISLNYCFMVKLFIETKDCHLGPFTFEIYPRMTLGLLKLKVEEEYGIVSGCQRWILGEHLAVDNDRSLIDYSVVPDSSIFLYVDYKSMKYRINSFQTDKNTVKELRLLSSDCNTSDLCVQSDTVDQYEGRLETTDDQHVVQTKTPIQTAPTIEDKKSRSKYHEEGKIGCLEEYHNVLDTQMNDFPGKVSVISNQNIGDDLKSPELNLEEFHNSHLLQKSDSENIFYDAPETYSEKTVYLNQELTDLYYPPISVADVRNKTKCCESILSHINISETDGIHPHDITDNYQSDLELKVFNDLSSTSKFEIMPENAEIHMYESVNKNLEENMKPVLRGNDINLNESHSVMDLVSSYRNINVTEKDASKNFSSKPLETIDTEPVSELIRANWVENNSKAVKIKVEENKQFVMEKFVSEANGSTLTETQNLHQEVSQNLNKPSEPRKSVTALLRKLSMRKANSKDNLYTKEDNTVEINGRKEIEEKPDLPHSHIPFIDVQVDISKEPEIVPQNEQDEGQIDNDNQIDAAVQNSEIIKNFEILMEIENMDLVQNTTNFKCPVCFEDFESGQGVVLHDCLHIFCRDCLINTVIHSDGALIKCPYRDDSYSCLSHLQQREIKALVTEEVYERYLQRSIITAEGLAERSFHCKTLNCLGWCIYDNAINVFHCPVCLHYNCLNCQAIHEGLNCRQYQDKLKEQQKVDHDAEKTLEFLNKMIDSGKALRCPKCDLILMKKWGCDWLKCSICKTEICWITKGPRWGPGGQGDTSGGCRCGVKGVKCHPSCTYCH